VVEPVVVPDLTRRQVVALHAEMDLMKEKFAKLLLGEDMSGSGKGVPSALALSNAVTNLAGVWPWLGWLLLSNPKPDLIFSLSHGICVSYSFTSFCVRRATEAGAHGPGQKGEVEERSGLASVRR
jgi:hypothetical protein